jgi:hypothetical protein
MGYYLRSLEMRYITRHTALSHLVLKNHLVLLSHLVFSNHLVLLSHLVFSHLVLFNIL